jgi:hypothetical protein
MLSSIPGPYLLTAPACTTYSPWDSVAGMSSARGMPEPPSISPPPAAAVRPVVATVPEVVISICPETDHVPVAVSVRKVTLLEGDGLDRLDERVDQLRRGLRVEPGLLQILDELRHAALDASVSCRSR